MASYERHRPDASSHPRKPLGGLAAPLPVSSSPSASSSPSSGYLSHYRSLAAYHNPSSSPSYSPSHSGVIPSSPSSKDSSPVKTYFSQYHQQQQQQHHHHQQQQQHGMYNSGYLGGSRPPAPYAASPDRRDASGFGMTPTTSSRFGPHASGGSYSGTLEPVGGGGGLGFSSSRSPSPQPGAYDPSFMPPQQQMGSQLSQHLALSHTKRYASPGPATAAAGVGGVPAPLGASGRFSGFLGAVTGTASPSNSGRLPPVSGALGGSVTSAPVALNIKAVCLNAEGVDDMCADMELDRVDLQTVDIIPVSSGDDEEYVIWSLLFSNGPSWHFPESKRETSGSTGGNEPANGSTHVGADGSSSSKASAVVNQQQQEQQQYSQFGGGVRTAAAADSQGMGGPVGVMDAAGFVRISATEPELDLDALPKYMPDDDMGRYIFD